MIIFSEVWLPEHCTLAECLFHTYLLELFVWSPQSRLVFAERVWLLERTFGDQMRWWKEHFEGAVNLIFSLWRRKRWGNPGEEGKKNPCRDLVRFTCRDWRIFQQSHPLKQISYDEVPVGWCSGNVLLIRPKKMYTWIGGCRFLSWSWKTETGLLSNCKACKGTNKILSLVQLTLNHGKINRYISCRLPLCWNMKPSELDLLQEAAPLHDCAMTGPPLMQTPHHWFQFIQAEDGTKVLDLLSGLVFHCSTG